MQNNFFVFVFKTDLRGMQMAEKDLRTARGDDDLSRYKRLR